jgi:hypothetical protein
MRSRRWIALTALAGAAVATAVLAWPAAARQPKPLDIRGGPPLQLQVVRTVAGDVYPHDLNLEQLIPARTHVMQVWFIAGGGKPKQVLVEWEQNAPVSEYGAYSGRWGLKLWTLRTPRGPRPPFWRAVNIPVFRGSGPGAPYTDVSIGDATGDGHPDVLVQQEHWNQGCGPHEVVATLSNGQVWRVFNHGGLCNTIFAADHGLLKLDIPYFTDHEPVCCPNKHEDLRLRWNGTRYVTESVHIS